MTGTAESPIIGTPLRELHDFTRHRIFIEQENKNALDHFMQR